MDAIVASQHRLPELLEASRTSKALHSDGLFMRRSTAQTRDEPLATLSLRILSPNVNAIDDLVARVDAPSRSALCVAALQDYLDVAGDAGGLQGSARDHSHS